MAGKFQKRGGKQKTEPKKVARKSKTILRRKLERQQKKQAKKQARNQFHLDKFAKGPDQPLEGKKNKKTPQKPVGKMPGGEEVHQRTLQQMKDLEKQQKEQRKGCGPP